MYRIEITDKDNPLNRISLDVLKQVTDSLVSTNLHEYIPDGFTIQIVVDPKVQTGTQINKYLSVGIDDIAQGEYLQERLYAFHLALTDIVYEIEGERQPIAICIKRAKESGNSTETTTEDETQESMSFQAVEPKFQLGDVILTEKTKQQIDRAIALVNNQTKIFQEWGFSRIDPYTKTILCFYGKPGTGKTMCAHGLANALQKKLILASYASIESKWVGEGPKNLRKIFADAIDQDAILFFDEADSFLSKRIGSADTGSDKHYNRMSNEMFQLLENHNGIVVFATNMVSDFDKAFKSRILAFVELELPDRETRAKIISSMLLPTIPMSAPLSEQEILQLSDILDGFSGRDIRKAILTTLSDGAMRNVEEFCYNDFEKGFIAIKEGNDGMDKALSRGSSLGSIVDDFLQTTEENSAILDICLNTIWQSNDIENATRKSLLGICKILDIDMPDIDSMTYVKDIDAPSAVLKGKGRESECLQYCCDLLATNNLNDADNEAYICKLADALDIHSEDLFKNYYKSKKEIKQ